MLWITRFIPRYFSRVRLLGGFYFEIISKYILLLISTANTNIQISTTVDNSWMGGVEGGEDKQEEVLVFFFPIAMTAKIYRSVMLTLRKFLEG